MRDIKVQSHRGAEVQKPINSEAQRCKSAEVQKQGYHNLLIWQKAKELVLLVYKITDKFPKTEQYGLTSQTRRAVISVVLNIVEGDRRKSRKEFLRFLDICDGSLTELEACFELAFELNYVSRGDNSLLTDRRRELARMLFSFIKSVENQK